MKGELQADRSATIIFVPFICGVFYKFLFCFSLEAYKEHWICAIISTTSFVFTAFETIIVGVTDPVHGVWITFVI